MNIKFFQYILTGINIIFILAGFVLAKNASSNATEEPFPWEMLNDPKFKSAYHKALGSKVDEKWLARIRGTGSPTRVIKLAGEEYRLIEFCKPSFCPQYFAVLLYSATQGMVYGEIEEEKKVTHIGLPLPSVILEYLDLKRRKEHENDPN